MEQESETKSQAGANTVFKVLFRGVILSGFDKVDVIKNVHDITRIPETVITRKFFSGKTVVIRHADTQEYATRLQKTFAQAGIETYIEELLTAPDSSDSDEDLEYYNEEVPAKTRSSALWFKPVILLLAIIAGVGLAFLGGFFDHTQTDKKIPVVKDKSLKKNTSELKNELKNELKAESIKVKEQEFSAKTPSKTKPEPDVKLLFSQSDIKQYIKITHPKELVWLKQFIKLFKLSENQKNAINELIEQNINVSSQTPLFLFSTKENFALFLNASLSKAVTAKIKSELGINSICPPPQPLTLEHNKNYTLISNLDTKSDTFYQALNKSLLNLEALFATLQEPAEARFYFYSNSSQYPGFKIIASEDQFNLSFDNHSKNNLKANEHLQTLGITVNTPRHFNSRIKNVWDLSLLYISLNTSTGFSKPQDFTAQIITQVNPKQINSYHRTKVKRYQKKLDIDFKPQWTSGPFAITTQNLQFENNTPYIEILAKGQNIDSFIEYSPMASLTTTRVLDNKGNNVLATACTLNQEQYNSRLFKNIDGEQEAFIDNDFVSFKSIASSNKLPLKPETQLANIREIEGFIELHYPQKIVQKTLSPAETLKVISIGNFIFLFNLSEQKIINYQILGNTAQFLSLRAYNKNNEIIKTTGFQYQNRFNHSILAFKQSFAQAIHKLEVFYSPEYQNYVYPLKLKPEIKASQPLSQPLADKLPIAPEYDKLNIHLLNEQIRSDNPQWLGEKIASVATPPLYIKLFKQAGENQTVSDAIVNIKLSLTPLIHDNLSAIQLKIEQSNTSIYNNFIHFTHKTLAGVKQEYLDSNTAIQMDADAQLQGQISLYLPRKFNQHYLKFKAPGQKIDTDSVQITFVRQTSRELEFEVNGDLKSLVQLKIYDKDKKLISNLKDYTQLDKTHARLTLFYYAEPASINIITGNNILTKHYHFEL